MIRLFHRTHGLSCRVRPGVLIGFLLVGFCSMLLTGCGEKTHKYRIGVSQCSDDEWRSQMNSEIRREAMFHEDAEVEIRTSNDDNAKQIADLNYFVENKFDLIIVSPRESHAITPAVRHAYEAGIPVIVFDRAVYGNCYTSFMELDNAGIGRAAARYAAQALGNKDSKVIELRGLDDSSPARDRHNGFTSVIDSLPHLSVAASAMASWKQDPAYRITDSLLKVHPDIRAVYAHNDLMALGASEAIKKHGRRDIIIIGTDAAPSLGIRAVADSLIDATFIYPTEGERVLRLALSILKGEPYPRIDFVPAQYAVDLSNADILLRQNQLLNERTRQLEQVTEHNLLIRSHQKSQNYMLIAVSGAAVLLIVTVALLVRYLRQRHRFDKILIEKNTQLEAERDRQEELYSQLEEATRSKLMFFTNVSHDLRTPLTLISEPVKQVISQADYLQPQHRSLLNMAMRNIQILHRLIEQILDFRRYQNGRTEIHLQEVCPGRLVAEWTDAFRTLASKRNIRLICDTNHSADLHMASDVEKLERIFYNLLSNAFKYSPDGSTITVQCRVTPSEMTLSVADTGIGISEEDCRRIFDRFYQANNAPHSGSGIGLSLTKAFVELLGGQISVESKPGHGSVFRAVFPVSHVEDDGLPAAEPGARTDKIMSRDAITALESAPGDSRPLADDRPLLLVVDDSSDILELLQELLGDRYNIITASDGQTALRLSTRYVPELIISDIMMPGMDGLEFCRLVKEEISTSHIPILMITACKLDEQRVKSYDSGADSFISKPFSAEVLRSRVSNLLLNRKRIHNLYADPSHASSGSQRDLPSTNDPNSVESAFYRRFIEIVAREYGDSGLSVGSIAEAMGLGAAQLTRKIKALTGLTPVDIIRNYRLREGRRLLLASELAVSEIAYATGFSSPQYFAKCYREEFGMTPSETRSGKGN